MKGRRRAKPQKPRSAPVPAPEHPFVLRDDVPRPCGCVETWELSDRTYAWDWMALTFCIPHDPTRSPDWGTT